MSLASYPKAWALTAISGDKQWGGNTGYDDDPTNLYRYDSQVANHRRLREGDIVVVRDRNSAIGISIVQSITFKPGKKKLRRCPACRTASIKRRRKAQPTWRCKNSHEFDEPDIDWSDVMLFEAHFGKRFVAISTELSVKSLKMAALRPNDQLSIEELDPVWIERELAGLSGTDELFLDIAFKEQVPILANISNIDNSLIQERKEIMRSIALRRGQAAFRKRLLARYGPRCLVSGCQVIDLVEAAHIIPYAHSFDNGGANGLLLRSDLHTLFDLRKIAVHPSDLTVHIHTQLQGTEYSELLGTRLNCLEGTQPSKIALEWRWKYFAAS